MSTDFNNAYNEILFENLVSIIKQNFLFQTQLKINEKISEERDQLKKSFEELNIEFKHSIEKNKEIDQLKQIAQKYEFLTEEKDRIQKSLNDYMQKNIELQKELDDLKNSLKETKNKKVKEIKKEVSKTPAEINTEEIKPIIVLDKKQKIKTEKFSALKKNVDGSSF